jgi:DNA-binding beta-propeller fold protein YncE
MKCRGFAVLSTVLATVGFAGNRAAAEEPLVVGKAGGGRIIVPTNQVLTPAGQQITFPGRPTDLALLPNRRTVAIKNLRDLILLNVETGRILQTMRLPSGSHSAAGLAVADGGDTIYSSATGGKIHVARRSPKTGLLEWSTPYSLPAPPVHGDPGATGLALAEDGRTLLALSGRGNQLVRFDREEGNVLGDPISVGVAPFGIVVVSSKKAYVSNWGGDPPQANEPQALSSRTPTKIDRRTGAAASGSVSVVDLEEGRTVKSIPTGLHPSGLALSPDLQFLYVACANSDTVDVIDTRDDAVVETIFVRPEARLPFGSGPNALALSLDGAKLYVANGTNNAVGVVALGRKSSSRSLADEVSRTIGYIPTGWYPGAIVVRPWERRPSPRSQATSWEQLVVANIKGLGSRSKRRVIGFNSHDYLGSVSIIPAPDRERLETHSRQVAENNRQDLALAGLEPPRPNTQALAVPERHGEPSLIKNVIYIIKENRTYDQVFGDIAEGNGDPRLLLFGREVTPNQHALADEFVLLDNFYCSGVLSADGHAWATEAYATDYLERQFGGFVRSYPFDGDDPLAYATSGFLWDNALAHGLTFRDYGEFVKAEITPRNSKWIDVYNDYRHQTQKVKVHARPTVATLKDHFCPTYVGFPGTVPDVYRAREFLKEFEAFVTEGTLPRLIIMLLPNNHTDGTRPNFPTPRAMVADNDLALGQIVEAVTHSPFWPTCVIFVAEDDPQAGLDHVDGHRAVAQVISPYTRRGTVDHSFYSQVGMVKTIELILGLPPMNQMDLAAPAMRTCFNDTADLRPYNARANAVPLDEMNRPLSELSGPELLWAQKSLELDLDDVDDADEDTLNRILWHATRGYDVPYPRMASVDSDDDDDDEGNGN